ncbi:MAG TPA: adenylate/guanylate cyclase domain-containing protein [Phototrophicaceae bacterium]|nr:adenylate/guanylate cyclase domain-containing protein [Phototrophicaceae bacterium]
MERILIIDDGRENREFIAEYVLQPNGYEVLMAKDGKEGLDMILDQKPDLILLDYQLPRMNGIEVLQAMVERGVNIPVIMMTFYGSEEVAVDVYRLGVRDYIKKPFSVEEMLLAIERSLGDGRLRREKEALTERLIQSNRELQTRLQELNVLYSVGKSVTSLTEMEQLLPRIVDAAIKLTSAEEGHLYLVENDKLVCRALKRHNTPRAASVSIETDDPVAQHVAKSGQPLILTPEQSERSAKAPVSIAAAPLTIRNEVIGVLGVSNISTSARIFNKYDSALLSALTDYAAIAIENSRNYAALNQTKEREKSQIRSTFGRFVPHQVVDQVLDDPNRLQLGGKRQEITIMFIDIRGYTAFAENAAPEKVVEMLNDYLSLAANEIMAYGGTLDKYLGDGLMAMFNAPEEQPDHVLRAVEAALDLQQAMTALEAERQDGLSFGIGIGVGEAVVGYIGTDIAVNYTAIGDVVNLTKRLQDHAQPGQILIDESVVARLQGTLQAHALGELKLKGRQKHARVYELQAIVAT